MSGLTPEKRLDKTGKLVTRHIRYSKEQPTKKPIFPSVAAMFGRDSRFPGNTRKMIDDGLSGMSSSERKSMLMTLNDDTMSALHAVGVGIETDESYVHDNGFAVVIRLCAREGSFALLNNIAFFAHDSGRQEASHTIHSLIAPVKGLIRYQKDGAKRIDYTNASEEELDDARTLLAAGLALGQAYGGGLTHDYNLYTGEGGGTYLDNEKLITMFREAGRDETLRIASFIKEQKMPFRLDEDVENLRDLFNMHEETHNALDDGIL